MMFSRRYFCCLCFFFIVCAACFSLTKESVHAREISNTLYENLLRRQMQPQKQFLTGTENPALPFSIIIDFDSAGNILDAGGEPVADANNADTDTVITADIPGMGTEQSQDTAGWNTPPQIVLSIPQEMAVVMDTGFYTLLEIFKDSDIPVSVRILLTAGDFPLLETPGRDLIPTGTGIFLSETEPAASTAVLVFSPPDSSSTDRPVLIPGSGGYMSPLWLIRQIQLDMPRNSLLSYWLNLAPEDSRLQAFLEEGFAAAAIRFNPSDPAQIQTVQETVLQTIYNFVPNNNPNLDTGNYLLIETPRKIWIPEYMLVVVYIITAALVTAASCGFSITGKKSGTRKKDLAHVWYLIPITILLSALSLYAGQHIALALSGLTGNSPFSVLIIKTFCSFFFVSLLFIAQVQFRVPVSQVVYGYLLSLVAVLNIFIFTSFDIVLLVVFLAEYFIIVLARITRRLVPLIVSACLMFIPFIPFAVAIWNNLAPEKIMTLTQPGPAGNILYACILVPFQIMWLRILVRMNIYGKTRKIPRRKALITTGIIIIGLLVFIAGGFSAASWYLGRRSLQQTAFFDTSPVPYQDIIQNRSLPASYEVQIQRTPYLKLQTIRLRLSVPDVVLRYDVSVSAPAAFPVYDAEIPYDTVETDNGTTAFFLIPDAPASDLSFAYTAPAEYEQHITVKIYTQDSGGTVQEYTRNIILPAVSSGTD